MMMSRVRSRFGTWGLATFILLAAACGREDAATPGKGAAPGAEQVVVARIGSASPPTGPQAHIGIDIRNGVQLAVDDVNAADVRIGGRRLRLELLAEDDEANPTKAKTVAQKLVDEGVV